MEMDSVLGWIWWSLMLLISIFNIILLFFTFYKYPSQPIHVQPKREYMVMKASAFIFTIVCAYRSILPRIDVPRICWFDTFLNWILFERICACIAEICWATQMGLLLRRMAICMKASIHFERAGISVIIIAFIAEISSWTNLITENNLFAVFEQFLWMILFEITGIGILLLLKRHKERNISPSYFIFAVIVIIIGIEQGYEAFGLYLVRYIEDQRNDQQYYGFVDGLNRLAQCAKVTQNMSDWKDDAPWMTGYFSIGVWSSIWLYTAPFGLTKIGRQTMLNSTNSVQK